MPPRNYRVYGPLDIPRTDDLRQVDRKRLSGFWKNANDAASELATATGCYIFGIRAGKGARPWYVGQAKKSFKNECFTPHKLLYYNTAVLKRQGTPIMFLVARMTPGGQRFVKKLGQKEADWVENLLIRHCLDANKNLLNISGIAFSTEVMIPGLFRSPPGQPSNETTNLRRLLNL